MSLNKSTPCDYGECPYHAMYSEECEYYCGYVEDVQIDCPECDEPEDNEPEESENYSPFDGCEIYDVDSIDELDRPF